MLTVDGAQALRQVRDHLLAHPSEFDMYDWDCGTTACIAGHLVRCRPSAVGDTTREKANTILSLPCELGSSETHGHGHPLFYRADWPIEFREQYRNATYDSEKATAAAGVIDAFLWQHGFPPNEIQTVDVASDVERAVARAL